MRSVILHFQRKPSALIEEACSDLGSGYPYLVEESYASTGRWDVIFITTPGTVIKTLSDLEV